MILCFQSYSRDYLKIYSAKTIPPDTTVLPQILALPLSSYIGKPVDSLLAVLPNTYTLRGFMYARFGYTKGVIQGYGISETNNCQVEIYVDSFQFQSFPNRDLSTWSMVLAGKETISFIRIMKNNNSVCLYGCNNPQYHYLDL